MRLHLRLLLNIEHLYEKPRDQYPPPNKEMQEKKEADKTGVGERERGGQNSQDLSVIKISMIHTK